MKNLFTLVLLFAVGIANAQYFQQRFNLNYPAPKFRNERCNSGIKTRVNLAGANPANYYFASIGTSYLNKKLPAPDSLADRMRFIRLNNTGGTVLSNLGYQFADVGTALWYNSYGNSIAEIKNQNGTGGYVTVGEIKNNTTTGAGGITGGSDALFTRLNAAGGVVSAVRYNIKSGSDRAWCIRRSVVTSGGQPTWIICGESQQSSTNTVCFVARVLVTGAIVWFNSYSFDPSGGTFSSSINIAKQLCEDKAGYIYVVGTLQDVPAAATGIDALAFKLTPAGAVVWANSYHAYTDDEYQAVRFTADGNIITGGFTNFGAVAPVTSHMLIAKLSSATGAVIFENVLVESLNGSTYTSKCYDIIETAGSQYFLSGPGTFSGTAYETMYKTNAGGFGISWYRYNKMNYTVGFGLDSVMGKWPGVAYFSSLRNFDSTRVSDSHIMKTNYIGQTCKFCAAYKPNNIQFKLQLYQRNHLVQPEATLRQLAWQIFSYNNKLICNDSVIHCAAPSLNNNEEISATSMEKTAAVEVSPNPVNSLLHLHFKDITPGNYTIQIANRQGNIVLQKANVYCDKNSIIDLNVSRLFSGIYLIKISNGATIMEQKILKE